MVYWCGTRVRYGSNAGKKFFDHFHIVRGNMCQIRQVVWPSPGNMIQAMQIRTIHREDLSVVEDGDHEYGSDVPDVSQYYTAIYRDILKKTIFQSTLPAPHARPSQDMYSNSLLKSSAYNAQHEEGPRTSTDQPTTQYIHLRHTKQPKPF